MAKYKYDVLKRDSHIIRELKDGELLIIGMENTNSVLLLYKYMGVCYEVGSEFKPFVVVSGAAINKIIKSKCDIDYVKSHFRSKEKTSLSGHSFCVFVKGDEFEVTGQSLCPYDYVLTYAIKTFKTELGLVVGKGQVLTTEGKVKNFNICRKLNDVEVDLVYQQECNNLKLLYQSRLREKMKSLHTEQEYHVGDVYKSNDYISIYLGKRVLSFSINNNYLKMNNIDIKKMDIEYYYSNPKDLWYRFKWTQDIRVKQVILEELNGNKTEVTTDWLYTVMLDNMGSYRVYKKTLVTGGCTNGAVYGPIDTLRYNLTSRSLGCYFTHWDIDMDYLSTKSLKSTVGVDKKLYAIRNAIYFNIL